MIRRLFFLLLAVGTNAVSTGTECEAVMSRVGTDVQGELDLLTKAHSDLKDEWERFRAAGFELSPEDNLAVANFEHLDPNGHEKPSSHYLRRISGLTSFVEVEMRRRKALLLYSSIKSGSADGAKLEDKLAMRLLRRLLATDANIEVDAAQLLRLSEASKLYDEKTDLQQQMSDLRRPFYGLQFKVEKAERELARHLRDSSPSAEEVAKLQQELEAAKRAALMEEEKIAPQIAALAQ